MTPLKQQLIDEMAVRRFSPKTHASYLRWVKDLSTTYVELSRFAEDFPLTYPIDQTYDVSID